MVYNRLLSVIESLAKCNGTFDDEVSKLVSAGELTAEDVPLVVLYAKMRKLTDKLTSTATAVDSLE